MQKEKVKVSIIVPIFNVEQYLERCVQSLFSQTYDNIEYIFVDDGSTDNSIQVLNNVIKSISRKLDIKVLKHEKNLSLPTARNTGLDCSSGEYIAFLDSDDWVESNWISDLVGFAIAGNYDITYCDYYESYDTHEKYISQCCGVSRIDCLKKMFMGKMHCSVSNKMFRRSLFVDNRIRFVDGANMFEDVGTVCRLFSVTQKIGYKPSAYFHYVQYNKSSIIKSRTDSNKQRRAVLQQIKNLSVVSEFLCTKDFFPEVEREFSIMKLNIKKNIITQSRYSLLRWIVTFPEADKYILNHNQYSISGKLSFLLLHYKLVNVFTFFAKLKSVIK